jgi:hypothetical protein
MTQDQLYKLIENSTSIWDSAMITIQAIFIAQTKVPVKPEWPKRSELPFPESGLLYVLAEKD